MARPRRPEGARRQRALPWQRVESPGRSLMAEAWVAAVIARQGGRCPICEEPLSASRVIDHDHARARLHGHADDRACPRCVRAVLCRRCNALLGFAKDSVELLARAAAYLVAARGS